MLEVKIIDNNPSSFEKAMKLFKKICQKDGFMIELRERQYYKKPSVKKREAKREKSRNKK